MSPKPSGQTKKDVQLLPEEYRRAEPINRYLRWALGAGRVIIVLTEALVLTVFFARFKLDADRVALEKEINAQTASIQAQTDFEQTFRRTQERLTQTSYLLESVFYPTTPLEVLLASLPSSGISLTRLAVSEEGLAVEGESETYQLVSVFWQKLRGQKGFEQINLTQLGRQKKSAEEEEARINFALEGPVSQ